MTETKRPPKPENLFLNLLCNIAVPTVVLMKFSTDRWLGPLWGLIVALAFPISYGAYDLLKRKKTNFLSVLGFVSVLLSGSMGLLKVGGLGFAIKDAVLPTVIGVAVLLTLRTKRPLVREIFFNESIVDVPRVESALAAHGAQAQFEGSLRRASLWLAATFLASAPVNFALARYILRSPPGTAEFNAELGKMHWVGPLVIAVPSMAVMMAVFWKLFTDVSKLTGLTQDEIFQADKK
jgi:hypothetical protein